MKFEKALEYMREGLKVRRMIWGRYSYIKIGYVFDEYNVKHGTFVTRFNNEVNVTRMIEKNDWEIFND